MPRQKLTRYERTNQDPRVIQWLQEQRILFPDAKHIVLELACGRWEYSVWLAPHYPEKLFVWIDNKWDRIWVWLARAHEAWVENVRFVCGIIHHLDRWFEPASIEEIRIVHPDPRPRGRDERRRLTNPRFLAIYKALLKQWGMVRLKTDDKDLFTYSVQQFAEAGRECLSTTTDLYSSTLLSDQHGVQTHYEKLALEEGKPICYGVWRS